MSQATKLWALGTPFPFLPGSLLIDVGAVWYPVVAGFIVIGGVWKPMVSVQIDISSSWKEQA